MIIQLVIDQSDDVAARKEAHIVEAKRSFGIRRLPFIVACLLLAGGCATAERSDRSAAIACIGSDCADNANNQIALLSPQPYQETSSYYSSHCDEQTRERQHELANCNAVSLFNIPLESSPRF
jgi:hypothetical protein